jgi:outer membrane protein assembly factor BamB
MSEYTVSANANGSLRQPILFGANAATGQVLWQLNMTAGPTLGGEQSTAVTVYNGIVYSDPPESGSLYAFNATTGAQLWAVATGKDTCNANIYDGNLWISNSTGTIFVLNPVTGAVLNSTNIGVTINDGDIVFVNQNLILWEMSGQVISMPTSSIYNP